MALDSRVILCGSFLVFIDFIVIKTLILRFLRIGLGRWLNSQGRVEESVKILRRSFDATNMKAFCFKNLGVFASKIAIVSSGC